MQSLPKSLFVFVFCVPLAIVFGVLLANPLDRNTMLVVLGGFLLLLSPILLKYHHAILIVSCNAYINAFFLPGQPYMWMLMTIISIFMTILISTVNRGKLKLIYVPSVARPLILLFLLTVVTAALTGGVGAQILGSEVYGGKRYLFVWAGIAVFFAISTLPVEERWRQMLANLFFISSATAVLSNIAFMLGERFYYLFLLFPAEWAVTQAAAEISVGGFTRIAGLAPAGAALLAFVLVRWGLQGLLVLRRPWRLALFLTSIAATLLSGFRSNLVLIVMMIAVQFYMEGLHRTRLLFVAIVSLLVVSAAVLPFADKLPLSAQRCLTILPLDLDRSAIDQAKNSTDWRLDMWRALVPDIPKYFWLGKGFALDPKDMYFSQSHISVRKFAAAYEPSLVAGDYHNGPLTLIIPLGIFGVIFFGWFYIAGFNVIRQNLKYGDPAILNINRFIMTAYVVKFLFFCSLFGLFYLDLVIFTSLVALSISMNRGVAAAAPALVHAPVKREQPRRLPAWQPAFDRPLQGT